MPLSNFHPAVAAWFEAAFGSPTEPQRLGWPAIQEGRDTLIAAPTGSGKTHAAFLTAIDSLVRQAIEGRLGNDLQVLYISPLQALSNDVQQNLAVPLSGVQEQLWRMGLIVPEIRTWVRTGDTPAAERTIHPRLGGRSAQPGRDHHPRRANHGALDQPRPLS